MSRKLTEKQRLFVNQVSRGINPTKAARAAEYQHPAVAAYQLMRLPHIREALFDKREERLKGDLAAMALDAMYDLMGSDTPAATRYNASRWVLEQAGHKLPDPEAERGKALEEMDADELAQAVQQGMSALQDLAGAMDGRHLIEGQARQVRDVEPEEAEEDQESAFLE